MKIEGKVAVVTGAASGIGAALARRFAAEGAAGVVVADIDAGRARAVAEAIGESALAVSCDVGREDGLKSLAGAALQRFGRIDVFMSNAGILGPTGGIEIADDVWERMWRVHLMAHVWAARAVVPGMLAQGEGYFWVTASAAGLLNIVESAPYGVTKHAAVGFAEWLRIAYGRRGIKVSCLCPQSVETRMTAGGAGSAGINGVLSADAVAQSVLDTMAQENFLCLPHPEVASYVQRKAQDYDRWLGGMQKMYQHYIESGAGHAASAGPIPRPDRST